MARTKKLSGTLRLKGKSWYLRLYSDGKPHYFTLGPVTKAEAEELAEQKEAELAEQAARKAQGLPGPMPFSELVTRFERERLPMLAPNTRRAYRGSLDRFREYFVQEGNDPKVHEVRQGHVRGFLNWRRVATLQGGPKGSRAAAKPASARTLQKDRAVLHALFSFAEELEIRTGNPVAKVRPPKADPREAVILSDEQYEALLAACGENDMLRLYVLALGETGGRCESEVLFLQWEDVSLEDGFLWIASGRDGRRTKSGKGRWVPLTLRLAEAFREHAARYRLMTYGGQRSPWVFHHPYARRHAKAGERLASLRRAFLAAAKRAGLPAGLHQHDLRHRRVTSWLAAGANPVHVKEAVGHSDLRTTMGYTHLAREHLRSLVPDAGTTAGTEQQAAGRS